MFRRRTTIAGALGAALLSLVPTTFAQDSPPPTSASESQAGPADPSHLWLDEVRAQRQAREKRRRVAREAMDARRRWIDPWGAAKKEAWEQETQRRREALIEKIERDRETFRHQPHWGLRQPPPWQDVPPGPAIEPLPAPDTQAQGSPGSASQPVSPYPLPGWDNRWYYRGF